MVILFCKIIMEDCTEDKIRSETSSIIMKQSYEITEPCYSDSFYKTIAVITDHTYMRNDWTHCKVHTKLTWIYKLFKSHGDLK